MSASLPINRLEFAISEAKAGRIPVAEMLRVFAASDLLVPSGTPASPDGTGLQPILFDRDHVPMIACFTAIERVHDVDHLASYVIRSAARTWLPNVGAGHGLVVNPGQPIGFEIDPEGLRRVLADFV